MSSWTSRDAYYRERILRMLRERACDPPWHRTTLLLSISARMPPSLGERCLRAMEADGICYGSPVAVSRPSKTVWRLRKRGREE